jgi:hypothetical protein
MKSNALAIQCCSCFSLVQYKIRHVDNRIIDLIRGPAGIRDGANCKIVN